MEAFNNCGQRKSLGEIEPGKYLLIELKKINTKLGTTLIAVLEINDKFVEIYLPKKYVDLSTKEIDKINKEKDLKLHFKGKVELDEGKYFYDLELTK